MIDLNLGTTTFPGPLNNGRRAQNQPIGVALVNRMNFCPKQAVGLWKWSGERQIVLIQVTSADGI